MIERQLPSYVLEQVGDYTLPSEIPGFEPGMDFVRNTLANCPVIFSTETPQPTLSFNDAEFGEQTEQPSLHRLSEIHGRSFELHDPMLPGRWKDEFGNAYYGISIKGNNFSKASLLETATATDRYVAFGLQELAVMGRVVRASEAMRRAGIGTEYILGLAEPTSFPTPLIDEQVDAHQVQSIDAYKEALGAQWWSQQPEDQRTAEQLVDIKRLLGRATFIISMRAMDTNIRMNDLTREDLFAQLLAELGPASSSWSTSAEDRLTFFAGYTIPEVARNLAKLHAIGLAHRYPNEQNVTALGSLVDTDLLIAGMGVRLQWH